MAHVDRYKTRKSQFIIIFLSLSQFIVQTKQKVKSVFDLHLNSLGFYDKNPLFFSPFFWKKKNCPVTLNVNSLDNHSSQPLPEFLQVTAPQ